MFLNTISNLLRDDSVQVDLYTKSIDPVCNHVLSPTHMLLSEQKISKNNPWLLGDTSVVVLIVLRFGVEFLCCLRFMCVFIFLVNRFGKLSGRLLGNSCSLG